MRFILLVITLFAILQCFSQPPITVMFSGIIVDTDSVPVPDVAIINIRTGITARTNSTGFFQINIATEDSLCIYHVAYKRLFLNIRDNGRTIVIEPEIQELLQVNVTNKKEQEQKNLKETVSDIKRLVHIKKLPEYDIKSRQNRFIAENGSHNKGFSPFFGPTTRLPLEKATGLITGNSRKRQLKKLTSHYHLVKKKTQKQCEK